MIETALLAAAALALLLFALAIRSGRWGLWLAGYVFVLLALAATLVIRNGGEPGGAAEESRDPASAVGSAHQEGR